MMTEFALSKQAWVSQKISVFHQKVNVRNYFSMLTISLSNSVNFLCLLRPVVEPSYVSRVLLLRFKFFQRHSGDVFVPGMGALCYRPIRPCPGVEWERRRGENEGGIEGVGGLELPPK